MDKQNLRKILILAPFDIFPPVHGGSAVVYNLIKHLSKRHRVAVLLSHLHSQAGKIDIVNSNISLSYCPRSIFDNFPVIGILFNPYYFRCALNIAKNFDPHVIQCEVLWTTFCGIYLKKRLKKPIVYTAHNVEYLKFKDMSSYSLLPSLIKKAEKTACHFADKIITLSEIDKNHLTRLYGILQHKIETVNSCVDFNVFQYHQKSVEAVRHKYRLNNENSLLTFVGNLNYTPNILAVKAISEIIYPSVIEKHPNATFLIIGQKEKKVMEYKKPNFIFTGYVEKPDLINLLSASDVVLVPIDHGSGIRIKILEAAACSRAIVSTEKGAQGLGFINNKEILLSRKVDSKFIKRVITLIEHKNLRETIGKNARKKVEQEYSQMGLIKKFQKIYEETIQL